MYDNKIQTIEPLAFKRLKNLTLIDLSRNNIGSKILTVEPLLFEGLESLTYIALEDNNIDRIPTRAFSKLSKLQHLWIDKNQIRVIEPLALQGLESLTEVRLEFNKIDTIPTQALSKLSKLQSLFLNYNHIHKISPFSFAGLDNITYIGLRFNQIDTIPTQVFSNLSKLHCLDLSNNRIHSVEDFVFDGLHNLTILSLYYNKIQGIATDAFSGAQSILALGLGGNLLTKVPSFSSQPRLSWLDLPDNHIANAALPSTYRYNYNHISIELSGNKIETLDIFSFSFLTGTTIDYIGLSDNNISSVGPGTFDALASIENLDLSFNPLSNEALGNIAVSCSRTPIRLLDLSNGFRTQNLMVYLLL